MKVKFQIDPDRLTLNDWIVLDGDARPLNIRDMLARFMVDEKGNYLPEDRARREAGNIPVSQMKEVYAQFQEAWKNIKDKAIPPAQGSG
jgi:hypothetical protein